MLLIGSVVLSIFDALRGSMAPSSEVFLKLLLLALQVSTRREAASGISGFSP